MIVTMESNYLLVLIIGITGSSVIHFSQGLMPGHRSFFHGKWPAARPVMDISYK